MLFDEGSSIVTDDAKDALAKQAAWLGKNPRSSITVAGTGDEHGTRDYNFALGYRRAIADRDILIEDGIEPSRITVLSYGDARPAPRYRSATTSVRCSYKRR